MKEFRLSDRNVPLPRGTDVVLRVELAAADGTRVKAGTAARVDVGHHHTYEVVTPSGVRLVAGRDQLAIQKREVADRLAVEAADWDALRGHAIHRAVVGSVAWGLAGEGSDVDVRGIFLLPFDRASSLFRQPEQIEDPASDDVFWEVEKFLHLLLRADGNAIELLWSPRVLETSDLAESIRSRRREFLSNNVVGSFGRYALSQMEKIERRLALEADGERIAALVRAGVSDRATLRERLGGDPRAADLAIDALVNSIHDRGLVPGRSFDGVARWLRASPDRPLFGEGPYRPKNAYNLIRLLHSGLRLVTEGEPLIEVEGTLRDHLLEVKRGEVEIAEVVAEARELGRRLEEAAAASVLPDEPPYRLADRLLVAARREAARLALRPRVSPRRPPAVRLGDVELPEEVRDFVAGEVERGLVQLGLVGAHADGFPSPDSDLDLKGIHVAPARAVLGLRPVPETRDRTSRLAGVEVDFTSHEAARALRLLLAGSGNVLERLASPFQVLAGRVPDLLREIALETVGLHFANHYRGFFRKIVREIEAGTRDTKTVLYAHRVALTGTHLFRTGEVVLDVRSLAEIYEFPDVPRLVAAKSAEGAALEGYAPAAPLERLGELLERSIAESSLPAAPPAPERVERILVTLRRALE